MEGLTLGAPGSGTGVLPRCRESVAADSWHSPPWRRSSGPAQVGSGRDRGPAHSRWRCLQEPGCWQGNVKDARKGCDHGRERACDGRWHHRMRDPAVALPSSCPITPDTERPEPLTMCTTAPKHREELQTNATHHSSDVVNIYLKNTTKEMWIQKTESYTETKCTGPKKERQEEDHKHPRGEGSGKLFTRHL